MKKRMSVILIILFLFILCGYMAYKYPYMNTAYDKQLTEREKLEDFNYMYAMLKENYPYFQVNKRINGIDWLSKKEDYISKIKSTINDDQYFKVLNEILSDLKNGHVSMIDKYFYQKLVAIYEKDKKSNKTWLDQLNNPKTIKRYSVMAKSKNNFKASQNNIIPNNVKTHIFENEETGYLSIHSFNSPNIEEDMKIIKPFLESIKNYKALIIDIRGNGGGDTRYWSDNIVPMLINESLENTIYSTFRGGDFTEEFLKCRYGLGYEALEPISSINEENLKNIPPELSTDFRYYAKDKMTLKPKNSIDFKGKIYLLVDRGVFSSSEAFAVFSKGTGFATLIGETTSGDGIGSDPAICALPNSGYVFAFSKQMGLTADGTCNFEHKTEPDIKVLAKINSNFHKDTAIQTVLKLID